MKRSLRCLLALAPLLTAGLAHAKDLPNLDAYRAATPISTVVKSRAASAPPAFVASTDDRRGVPTFLWAARPATPSASAALTGLTPEAAARAHLAKQAARYGLSRAALDTARVQQIHDLGRGGIIVILRQAPGGIEVFHNDVKILMDRNLDLVAIGGNLHAEAVAAPKHKGFVVGERAAIATAFKDLYGVAVGAGGIVDRKETKGDYHHYDLSSAALPKGSHLRFSAPARAKRVFFPLPDRLVPAYFLELQAGEDTETTSDVYAYVVAADDGRVLYREDLTHNDTFNYRVYADPSGDHRPTDGPIADYCPYPAPAPNGGYPAFAAPTLISIDGFNSSHDPWLPAGATVTTGNNVDAYTDDDAPDGFSGGNDIRATTTAAGTFDRVFDTSLGPQANDTQRMAAITDLFYVTNYLHDWWYDSGFNEAAGNAQSNNFGRGGMGGDPMHAEAQDGAPSKRNNSNMSVPADGASPRMQMYVWDGKPSTVLGVQPLNQNYPNGTADFGPQSFDLTGTPALVNDGNATVTDACEPITNNVSGKIALIDRGNCTFKQKAVYAQQAGAIGMLLVNNQANSGPVPLYDGAPAGTITIPLMSVSLEDGAAIKAALANGAVTVNMHRDPTVDRDGTLDNTVIAHEWGHYIHLRQVACGSAACSAESEGWGDFFALHQTVRQGDNLDAAYPLAQYATASFPDDPAYFGIRRYPYSVDFSKNALTFKHIADGVNLPANVPVSAYNAQVNNAEAHAAGEIWASMLFEAYVALLKESQKPSAPYTFDEARRRMGDYVEGGLKLAPTDPTYTEQRDAILAVAAAADPNDLLIMAQAFARRGAGTCAESPPRDSTDFSGVKESFTVDPNLALLSVKVDDSVTSCDSDGHLDSEETGKVTVTVMNTGTVAINGASATVTSAASGISFPGGATLSFGTIAPFSVGTASVDVALAAGLTKAQTIDLKVALQGVTFCAGSGTLETAPLANFDEVPMTSTVDTMETDTSTWTPEGDGADQVWSLVEDTPGNHVWAGVDYPSPTDTALVSPPVVVSDTTPFVLTFDHRHSFEQSQGTNWDGAVIEVSTNGGNTWQDISKFGDPGYGGTVGDMMANGAQNVLKGRSGYVGQNAAWPATDTVTVNMGTQLAGKTVRVRFRIGTDDAAGELGWEIDNVKFDGIDNKPFSALVDDKSSCGAPPIADAGPDQTVTSGQQVTLDGSMSTDPGSLPLTYQWTEANGIPVTLTGATMAQATFTAPVVTMPTKLTFKLAVSDGKGSASDTVDVLVSPGSGTIDGDAGADGGDMIVSSGGCDCNSSGTGTTSGAAAALMALAGLMARRRSRRG